MKRKKKIRQIVKIEREVKHLNCTAAFQWLEFEKTSVSYSKASCVKSIQHQRNVSNIIVRILWERFLQQIIW